MLPMVAVREQLGVLLAADATTLAPATNANKIALVTAPFSLSETLVATDLTYATFTGSTPKAGAAGPQGVGIDPATLDQVITILSPLGGYRFVCTVTPGAPETVYGFALLDSTLATLFAAQVLPVPVTISASGQEIDLGAISMNFVLQPLS